MKPHYLLTFLLFSTIASYAQLSYENNSASAGKQKLDSIKYEYYNSSTGAFLLESRQDYFYNESGDEVEQYVHLYNSQADSLVKFKRWLSEYNSFQNLVAETEYDWDAQNAIWQERKKRELDYDVNSKVIFDATHYWTGQLNGWAGVEKTENVFDVDGNLLSEAFYQWDMSGKEWKGINKTVFTYTSKGAIKSETTYLWEWKSGEGDDRIYDWRADRKFNYEYDEFGRKISFIESVRSGEWTNLKKIEYEYNVFDEVSLKVKYEWKNDTESWQAIEKYEQLSLENIHQAVENTSFWNSNDSVWVLHERDSVQFDGGRNEVRRIIYKKDYETDSIVPFSKWESEYDQNGNKLLEIRSDWDKEQNIWTYFFKIIRQYSAENLEIASETYGWDKTASKWIGTNRYENKPDAEGNLTKHVKYVWSNINNDWVEDWKELNEFDLSFSFEDLILPNWRTKENFSFKLLEHATYRFNSNEWKGLARELYFYSSNVTNSIKIQQPQKVVLYPNPVKDFVTISSIFDDATIEIISVQGVRLMSEKLGPDRVLYVGNLNPGLYFYKVGNEKLTHSGKIVIE
jgi:hypothetical protein